MTWGCQHLFWGGPTSGGGQHLLGGSNIFLGGGPTSSNHETVSNIFTKLKLFSLALTLLSDYIQGKT